MVPIILRLLPLYLLVALGYIAGKKLKISKEIIAPLLIYIFSPSVVFFAVLRAEINSTFLILPLISFIAGTLVAVLALYFSKYFLKGNLRNLASLAASDPNSGYFGIPIALALFGEAQLASYIMLVFGLMIFENTAGFYITARGNYSHANSLTRLTKLPTLYAFSVAVVLNLSGLTLSPEWLDLGQSLRGAYSVLGMMLIGLSIASLTTWSFDIKFNTFVNLAKFIGWPLVAYGIIYTDNHLLNLLNQDLEKLLLFISTMPVAANTVPFATILKVEPEKASVVVLLSTALATVIVPMYQFIFNYLGLQ